MASRSTGDHPAFAKHSLMKLRPKRQSAQQRRNTNSVLEGLRAGVGGGAAGSRGGTAGHTSGILGVRSPPPRSAPESSHLTRPRAPRGALVTWMQVMLSNTAQHRPVRVQGASPQLPARLSKCLTRTGWRSDGRARRLSVHGQRGKSGRRGQWGGVCAETDG